jgi:murein DD-endopeptidase MepM/ murein hydrolase activator NlpD
VYGIFHGSNADGVVDSVIANPAVNAPGTRGIGRAAVIAFRRADSKRVLYAHIQDIRVRPGDTVVAGQPIVRVGNNGQANFPHGHIGAWRGGRPLQIRFDLAAMGQISRRAQ